MKTVHTPILRLDGPTPLITAVRTAAGMLKAGGVILHPTDTIYGLGCLSGREEAIRRIYRIKGRPDTKPTLVLVDSIDSVAKLAARIPATARTLMDAFWPGPLTLLLPARAGVSSLLTAGTGQIGVRMPANEFCRRLIEWCGEPIVSTSANRSGIPPKRSVASLIREFRNDVDVVVDGGAPGPTSSTVIDVSEDTLVMIRQGAIGMKELASSLIANS